MYAGPKLARNIITNLSSPNRPALERPSPTYNSVSVEGTFSHIL